MAKRGNRRPAASSSRPAAAERRLGARGSGGRPAAADGRPAAADGRHRGSALRKASASPRRDGGCSEWYEGKYPTMPASAHGRGVLVEVELKGLATFKLKRLVELPNGVANTPGEEGFCPAFEADLCGCSDAADTRELMPVFGTRGEANHPLVHFCGPGIHPDDCEQCVGVIFDTMIVHVARWRYVTAPFRAYKALPLPPPADPPPAVGEGRSRTPRREATAEVGAGGGVSLRAPAPGERERDLRGRLGVLRDRLRSDGSRGAGEAGGREPGRAPAAESEDEPEALDLAARAERLTRRSASPKDAGRADRGRTRDREKAPTSRARSASWQEQLAAKARGDGPSSAKAHRSRTPEERRRRGRSRRRRSGQEKSASQSSSGDSSGSHFTGARLSARDRAKRAVERKPGDITQRAMAKMRRYLQGNNVVVDDTEPVFVTYLTSVFIPSTKGLLSARNDQEMRVLTAAVDCVLKGDLARATDVLVQQLKSVEQLHYDHGSWKAARHLSVVEDGRVSVMEDKEKEAIYRDERADMRAQRLQQQVQGSRRPADR